MFKAFISSEQTSHLVLRERPSAECAVLRPLFGLFPLGVGCLITYVLLSGGGPTPVGSLGVRIMGQVVVAVFFSVLGLLPLAWGLSELFVGGSFALRPIERVLEEHVTFAGALFWTIRHSFTGFERVTVRHEKFGVFGPRSHFVVACDGCRRVDLSAFPDRTAAEAFASDIGRQMSLPVVVRSLV